MKPLKYILIAAMAISSLALQAQPYIQVTTPYGGKYSVGQVIKTDLNGDNAQTFYNFKASGNEPYCKLLEVSPGIFYGTTSRLGILDRYGAIFEYDAANDIYTDKVVLSGENGSSTYGGLIKAANGKLYGITRLGGLSDQGVLYEYDYVNDVFTKEIDFSTATGGSPIGDLFEASNGKLYGLASNGGASGKGTLFEYNIATNTLTKKVDFTGAANGASPIGSVIEISGKLYGTTQYGGSTNGGTLFEYDLSTGMLTKKADFPSNSLPKGTPVVASNGKLYGSTTYNSNGTIYEYDPANSTFTIKANLNASNLNYGIGDLIEAATGKLYGVTTGGGTNGFGGIYEYDLSTSAVTVLLSFSSSLHGYVNNHSFIKGTDGLLYGTLNGNFSTVKSKIYSFNLSTKAFTNLYNLDVDEDMYLPISMISTSSGKTYGISYQGGNIYNRGTLFYYDYTTNKPIKKLDFGSDPRGHYPIALLEASDGKLYGRAERGGSFNFGMLFEYNMQTESFTNKLNLSSTIGGRYGGMIEVNGKLYLLCQSGATSGAGSIIEYDIVTGNTTTINHMASIGAQFPAGSPLLASNGKLYGTSTAGGANGVGVIFEYDIATGALTKKVDMATATGGASISTLVEGTSNKLYGLAPSGGANSMGTLFEYDIATSTFTSKINFNGTTQGGQPTGSLMKASNGKLYGATQTGGAHGYGTFFEYNPSTNAVTVKLDFMEETVDPRWGVHIEEVCVKPQYNPIADVQECTGTAINWELNSPNTDTYVWKKDGTVLSNETDGSVSFASLNPDDTGVYTVDITNACGTITLTQNVEVVDIANTYTIANEPCNGDEAGSIEITTTGGYTPYEYSIDGTNFDTVNSFASLPAGNYTVTTRNDFGCEVSNDITITEPDILSLSASFNGESVDMNVQGGTSPYEYSSDGTNYQSEANFRVANGTYTFSVRDANGCSTATTEQILITGVDLKEGVYNVDLYPNPAYTSINFSVNENFKKAEIISISGELVFSFALAKEETAIDITSLERGIYFLFLTKVDGGVVYSRFIKE